MSHEIGLVNELPLLTFCFLILPEERHQSEDLPGLGKGAQDHGWILEAQQQKRNPKPVRGET